MMMRRQAPTNAKVCFGVRRPLAFFMAAASPTTTRTVARGAGDDEGPRGTHYGAVIMFLEEAQFGDRARASLTALDRELRLTFARQRRRPLFWVHLVFTKRVHARAVWERLDNEFGSAAVRRRIDAGADPIAMRTFLRNLRRTRPSMM
jgi:hypothetical protein